MDKMCKDLGLNSKNVFPTTASSDLFTVVVHSSWLKQWLKNSETDNTVNSVDFNIDPGQNITYPWRKILIKVLNKKVSKVLPLPRFKLNETTPEPPLTFSQMLQYVSQTNQKTLWKESCKKYCQNIEGSKKSSMVNLLEHDQLLSEVISRLYGCNIIKLKHDNTGKPTEYKEFIPSKVPKSYETNVNLLVALFALETDSSLYIVYRGHYENSLLTCLNFSPAVINKNYSRGLFLIYQLLNVSKAMSDRGLSLGELELHNIYLSDNLWLQIVPPITNNVHTLDPSLVCEQNGGRQCRGNVTSGVSQSQTKREESGRNEMVQLEKLCMLWVRGLISNLDYLLHLNKIAGRSPNDPQTHYIVPWVTDFTSRCGKNWRDLSKSKYRLNKGDRQLDLTYETSCSEQTPHHVTDALTDITCYVYLARRTPKNVLCAHVRNKWVPAEYPASIQRMQQWTPDECIPQFYTDPTVFKSIHDDLPDLAIPSWATCVEDFIAKHREALESSVVSDSLHHWIDITFGYKLSGAAAVKAKNVCLSLVEGAGGGAGPVLRRGGAVQLWGGAHPRRGGRVPPLAPPALHRTHAHKKLIKQESSDEASEEEASSAPQRESRQAGAGAAQRRGRKAERGPGLVRLPKEFNPVATLQALETLHTFRTKSFFSKADDDAVHGEHWCASDLCPIGREVRQSGSRARTETDDTDRRRGCGQGRGRHSTEAWRCRAALASRRRRDSLLLGCLVVEIFLYEHLRPLRTHTTFQERYDNCRSVLEHNFRSLPRCVTYVCCLLLDVRPRFGLNDDSFPNRTAGPTIAVTDKGLPSPTASLLLQPLLMQHLIPFPKTFDILYRLLSALHEYELTSIELNILYDYECDGIQCEKYQNVDRTKRHYALRIAEGKIQACVVHLDILLSRASESQFEVLDLFLPYYVELLANEDTAVLAAWYLFDTVGKALGPVDTRNKLLKSILNLYEDDHSPESNDAPDASNASASSRASGRRKFIKLYHHIFLLQLIVRLGLECFLDRFVQHLVEAVGGYKDAPRPSGRRLPCQSCRAMAHSEPGHCDGGHRGRPLSSAADIFSPEASYGSDRVTVPSVDRSIDDVSREKDSDNKSDNEMFLFESDKEPSRSKSPSESLDSCAYDGPQEVAVATPVSADSEPVTDKCFSTNTIKSDASAKSNEEEQRPMGPRSPASPASHVPTKTMFTSYLHFADEDEKRGEVEMEMRSECRVQRVRSLDNARDYDRGVGAGGDSPTGVVEEECLISDMSAQSVVWLSRRLGPVLTCRHVTRNLLKMLTLCYIGKENLQPYDGDDKDEFDRIAVVDGRVRGDRSAAKVARCLHDIVGLYGEPVVVFQYLPHMCEVTAACCRRGRGRLSAALHAGVVAAQAAVPALLPSISDHTLMDTLQDTFVKSLFLPALRLTGSARAPFPAGGQSRVATVRKMVCALHALALRIGPEMTRRHLCEPALRRLFLAFDKAAGTTDNWLKQDDDDEDDDDQNDKNVSEDSKETSGDGFLEICRDGSTCEWTVREGRVMRADLPAMGCSPPAPEADLRSRQAQEELRQAFDGELAYRLYSTFERFIGTDALRRCLANPATIDQLCRTHVARRGSISSTSSPIPVAGVGHDLQRQREEPAREIHVDVALGPGRSPLRPERSPTRPDRSPIVDDQRSLSNSFGSNVTLVGNRIEINDSCPGGQGSGLDVVAYKPDDGVDTHRHLLGSWLVYWEHELGRPPQPRRFDLKQIRLQTFAGHTAAVKAVHCLPSEAGFMTASKDRTVRLWSLRNQGDGSASSQCSWAYCGHRRGVTSLTFVESLRLAVSSDGSLHAWDPFMETVVLQLDSMKSAVSLVTALPGPSAAVLAATADHGIKVVDLRAPHAPRDIKLAAVGGSAPSSVRCLCVEAGGRWAAAGLAGGLLAVIELRNGAAEQALWRAHDNEVLRVVAVDSERLVSSGLDLVTALWRRDGELLAHFKGHSEPVHCLAVYHEELICGTTNNRISVHSIAAAGAPSSSRLRGDSLRGLLTCMALLPLQRALLLASDHGTLTMLC